MLNKLKLWLVENAPVVLSPQFWGVVVAVAFDLCLQKGWIDAQWAEALRNIAAAATAIGAARKILKKP